MPMDSTVLGAVPATGPSGTLWMEPRLRNACRQFESNPLLTVLQLLQENLIPSDADHVASFLYRTTLLNRKQLGVYLGFGCRHAWRNRHQVQTSPYNQHMMREDPHLLRKQAIQHPVGADIERRRKFHHAVTWAFLDRFKYHMLPIDEALRIFMLYIRLPGDPHIIDYLLETFARHWYDGVQELAHSDRTAADAPGGTGGGSTTLDGSAVNRGGLGAGTLRPPRFFEYFEPASPELTVKLVYAIMTLNSDLHNPLLQQDMTAELAYVDFITKFKVANPHPSRRGVPGGGGGRGPHSSTDDLSLDELPLAEMPIRGMDQFETEVPTPYLQELFHRIRREKLEMAADSKRVMVRFQSAPECSHVTPVWNPTSLGMLGGSPPTSVNPPVPPPNTLFAFPPSFRNGPLNFSTDLFPARLIMHGPPSRELRAYLASVPIHPSPHPPQALVEHLRTLTPAAEIWVRIPYPDPCFCIRLYSPGLFCYPEVLDFSLAKTQKIAIYPTVLGRTSIYFLPRGRNSRVYSGLPVRSVLVEGGFMEHTLTVALQAPNLMTSSPSPAAAAAAATLRESLKAAPAVGGGGANSNGHGHGNGSGSSSSSSSSGGSNNGAMTPLSAFGPPDLRYSFKLKRYMFGFSSAQAKDRWNQAIQQAIQDYLQHTTPPSSQPPSQTQTPIQPRMISHPAMGISGSLPGECLSPSPVDSAHNSPPSSSMPLLNPTGSPEPGHYFANHPRRSTTSQLFASPTAAGPGQPQSQLPHHPHSLHYGVSPMGNGDTAGSRRASTQSLSSGMIGPTGVMEGGGGINGSNYSLRGASLSPHYFLPQTIPAVPTSFYTVESILQRIDQYIAQYHQHHPTPQMDPNLAQLPMNIIPGTYLIQFICSL
ncbi:hypothetical protein BJ085DRAFT_32580 [Dimargaris cristalligena]|uniref:SEC7 domain-containing protein n=1 Tax=Dimargaris cristalligena TaxID=215637 RepID=A0A4V1J3X6_9FUNG|nr:hypothetical protein BJ085DRAFT_32580 [Dimargaris cristalligena]|eukprot:RKP33589.1 hypothetical protein BJ085DRAFT_32580 [Dimargaris cristalligena]